MCIRDRCTASTPRLMSLSCVWTDCRKFAENDLSAEQFVAGANLVCFVIKHEYFNNRHARYHSYASYVQEFR